MKTNSNAKGWIITSAVVGIVLILAAIFFYNNFFRQTSGPLIETVPADAAFIFEINDNEQFMKTSFGGKKHGLFERQEASVVGA